MAKKFILVDGVSNYNTNDAIYKKWDAASNVVVSTSSYRRTGTNSLQLAAGTSYLSKFFDIIDATTLYENTITVGLAIKVNNTAGTTPLLTFFSFNSTTTGHANQISLILKSKEVQIITPASVLISRSYFPVITNYKWHYLEMQLRLATTTGAISVAVDGITYISIAHINTYYNSSYTELAGVQIGGTSIPAQFTITDIYIVAGGTQFYGPSVVDTIQPVSRGSSGPVYFTPVGQTNTYQCIDKVNLNDDAYYIEGSFYDQASETYNFEDLVAYTDTGYDISVLCITIAAGTVSPGHRKLQIRINSTVITDAYMIFSGTEYIFKQVFFETDPFYPALKPKWSVSDINVRSFGVYDTIVAYS